MAPITVRPDQLNAVAQFIREHSNRIQAAIQAIDAELKRMNADTFSGQSADALRARYNAMQQRLLMFAPMLNKFAAQLDEAAAAFRKADADQSGSGSAAGRSGASGTGWQMGSLTNGKTSGMGSQDHISAIQSANRSVTWRMW